jgi:hypothetical protein
LGHIIEEDRMMDRRGPVMWRIGSNPTTILGGEEGS